jgi:DNA-binding NarL/FixJ family response regulator
MKILIAEDHALVREGLRRVLEDLEPTGVICETSTTLAETREKIVQGFDLLVLDLRLPDSSGVADITELRQLAPAVPIVVVSASDQPADMQSTIAAGAAGYVPKTASHKILLGALRFVLDSGGIYMPPEMFSPPQTSADDPQQIKLTRRQQQVLTLLRDGASNADMARQLKITHGTVKLHVSAVLRLMGASRREDLHRDKLPRLSRDLRR